MFSSFTSLVLLALAASSLGAPSQPFQQGPGGLKIPPTNPQTILCKIPFVNRVLCPRSGKNSLAVSTPLGTAQGADDSAGVTRYAVRYATASRWQDPALVTSWQLPNGATDASALPMVCPQDGADSSVMSEDCLSMILYVPQAGTVTGAPTLAWFPGGSFLVGSATDAGLDGAALATATGAIVAVIQTRLGTLGYLSPDGRTNFGVKDAITSLKFLQKTVSSFGGNPSKITLAGQSSGATLVRALLAAPSASPLFNSAILQSDPMDYGFLSQELHTDLVNAFKSQSSCSGVSGNCMATLTLSAIVGIDTNIFQNAPQINAQLGTGEPIRPLKDGQLITTTLDSTTPFPRVNKPILVTNVLNEAGPAIYSIPTQFATMDGFYAMQVNAAFGPDRAATILNSTFYPETKQPDGTVDSRTQLEPLGTDYLWKCSSWTFARQWASHGASAYVGMFTLGATYPPNAGSDFCTQTGKVCHQDDIQIVFGTTPNPTSAQTALTSEVQKRYKAFLNNGNPNVPGLSNWSPVSNSGVNAHNFGGSAAIPDGACITSFWGAAAPYDYQAFNL